MKVGDLDGFGRFGVLDRDEDTVVCHECGKSYRSLVQHLHYTHQMSTADYRARHGLPAGLPLTCLETSRSISEKSAARVGTTDWKAFEEARDRTLPVTQRAATRASASHPAPAVTVARQKAARERFSGIQETRGAEAWRERLQEVVGFHGCEGRWPSRGVKAGRSSEEKKVGTWLDWQRRLAREGRQPAWKIEAMAQAGIDLSPGQGTRTPHGGDPDDVALSVVRAATDALDRAKTAQHEAIQRAASAGVTQSMIASAARITKKTVAHHLQGMTNVRRRLKWEDRLAEVVSFHEEHGEWPRLSANHPEDEHVLARWLVSVRRRGRLGKLDQSRLDALTQAGISLDKMPMRPPKREATLVSDPSAQKWRTRLAETVSFHNEHGEWPKYSRNRPEGERVLARWLEVVRRRGREGELEQWKLDALTEAGISLDKLSMLPPGAQKWRTRLAEVVSFHDEHGEWPKYSRNRPEDERVLATWIGQNRMSGRKGTLSQWKLDALAEAGISLDKIPKGSRKSD